MLSLITKYKCVFFILLIICTQKLKAQNDSISGRYDYLTTTFKLADSLYKLKKNNASEKKLHNIIKFVDSSIKQYPDIEHKSYNLLGLINSSLQKLDSSNYYFEKSLKALANSSETENKKQYISGVIKNRISLNLFNSGKTERSIIKLHEAITHLHNYINKTSNEEEKLKAIKKRLACIDNLAGFYRGVGENQRAIDLVTYSYKKKQKLLQPDDNGLIISQLILGHLHLIERNYKEAGQLTDMGIEQIDKIPFAKSYAYLVRASIYENIGDFENAKITYQKCEAVYRENFNGIYSNAFLDGLNEMSNFYTKVGMNEKALSLAYEGYNFTQQKTYKNDLLRFYQTQNLSLIYFKIQDYKKALKLSNEALSFFKSRDLKMNSLLDSVQNESRKPKSILIKSKSEYFLNEEHNVASLEHILEQTKKALDIVERKRNIIKTYTDLETLVVDNNTLIDFRKQLFLDLYNKTKNKSYLINLIGLHESSLYNRIRSRLNIKKISFSDVPDNIILREKKLKENMFSSLNSSSSSIEAFFDSNEKWTLFLDTLKTNYPKYYKMRYATIEEPLNKIHENIPKNTTVIRYLVINENLYAIILSATEKDIYKLNNENISDYIKQLSIDQSNIKTTSLRLHQLYKQLWKPLEEKINTENIIIIPDGELFNLSFESLTSKRISSFKEIGTNSLLAKHTISYNYSLLLLDKDKKAIDYKNDFVAFAPEFNEKMKDDYNITITDSLSIDKTYLSLLPQPFSVDLAKEYSRLFNGSFFINENASKQIFTNEANEHKIIHIGTHAESNNITPELSRLIFAKNSSDEDNSLYTYEIYNESLNSNLAILTACETGKPTYQAGEGMISLAHAFNYAGSESILTSLWKIDEQSSAKIIELFYANIKKGLPKDKALQQAKLHYLSNTEDRTVAPHYWAGLVLIGDTTPIDLKTSSNILWYLLSALLVILATLFIIKTRKK